MINTKKIDKLLIITKKFDNNTKKGDKMDFYKSIKYEIEKYINEKNITKKNFAKTANITLATLNNLLNCNLDNIKLSTLNKVLNTIGVECVFIKKCGSRISNENEDDFIYPKTDKFLENFKNSFKI